MLQERVDAAGLLAGKVSAVSGGASAVIFGLTANDFAAVCGVLGMALGLAIQLYFSRRRDRREQADRDERRAEFEARMAGYRERGATRTQAVGITGVAAAVVLAAAAFIAPREGLELKPYRDIVGVLTWCYGETRGTPKAEYTRAECEAMLVDGVGQFHAEMARCIKRPLTDPQWVAVTSWAFNVGTGAACGSTLVRQINAGLPATTWCKQLLRWDYAGGKRVRGLTNRRNAEFRECVK